MRRTTPWIWLAAALLAAPSLPAAGAEIRVSGRLQSAGGEPLPGAVVRLLPARGVHQAGIDQLAGRPEATPAVEVFTDEGGRFELLAPAAGLWHVRAAAEGFVPMVAQLRPLLEETFLPTVSLVPSRPLTVTVLDPEGKPLPGALVEAGSKSHRIWSSPSLRNPIWSRLRGRAVSGADGRVNLPRAEAERLEVAAAAPGFAPAEPVESAGEPVELRLGHGRQVTVSVQDRRERPLPGALISVGQAAAVAGVTDGDGQLAVTLPDDGIVHAITAEGGRGRVTAAREATTVRLELAQPPLLAGQVIELESRQPVAGALVWTGRTSTFLTRTDSSGRFELRAPWRGGTSWIAAAAAGYFRGRVQVSQTQEFEPVVALEPAAAASGVVVDGSGQPVAGAEISARFVPDSPAGRRAFEEAHTTSGDDGRFRFSDLTPGVPLELEAVATGFAPSTLELEAIEPRRPAVGLRLELDRGASLSGRVTGGGEPLPGAEAIAVRQPEGSSPMLLFARRRQQREESATAGEQGDFAFPNLRSGTYRLEISAPGFAALRIPGIEVQAGGVDLGSLELEPGAEVTGLVADPDGVAIEGAEVRASSQQWPMFGGRGGRAEEPAISGPDGAFVIADRRSGERVDLRATHPDYQSAAAPGVLAPNAEPVRLVLRPGARLSGVVVDATGAPLADALVAVMVEEAEGDSSGMARRRFQRPVTANSDDNGRFELAKVPAGRVRLTASAEGWRAAELGGLDVPEGGRLEDLRLQLERGATVTGRVFASDGRPAVDVWVEVREDRAVGRLSSSPSAMSGGDGQYLLAGVEPGLRMIAARGDDGEQTAREIEVGPGVNRLDLRFAAGATVSGRVVDDTGAPLAGANVMLTVDARQWGGSAGHSGADGTFTIDGMRDGQYLVRVTHEGYATTIREEPLEVAGGPVSGIELVMAVGGTVSGTIFGLQDSQIPLVNVFASGGPNQWSIGQALHDGTYRIEGLAPGEWHVQAMVPEGPQAQGRVTLEPGQSTAALDLDFSTGILLTGQVRSSGEPLGGLMVHTRGLDVTGWASGSTDHEGRFRLAGLQAGRHRLEVTDFGGGLRHRREIELDSDRDLIVEIFTGRLAGRVLDGEDLAPLAGARAELEPIGEDAGAAFGGWQEGAVSDPQGRFVIPRVASGDYRLKVVREGYAPAEQTVTVLPDGDLANLEILLAPTSGLRLLVRGSSGAPVAEVDYAILGGDGRALASGRRKAGEDGQVRLTSAPAGSHELLLAAPGAAVRRLRVEVPGPRVEVTLEASCRLQVRVEDLVDSGAAKMRITGADGVPFVTLRWGQTRREWELFNGRQNVAGLPAGRYDVEVTALDGQRWQGSVDVTPGAFNTLEL